MRDFSLLLNSNPTSLVLHFYAGLTGLSSRPVCELLRDIGRNPPGYECMRQQLLADQFAGGDLCNCASVGGYNLTGLLTKQ